MNQSQEIFTVTALTRIIRRMVDDGLPAVWVEGEVSNFVRHTSGHRYFTLKDEGAQIACVMWRTRPHPPFNLANGVKVRAFGKVTVYEAAGRYQLDVASVLPAGLGTLQERFEALKRKLQAEGLFDSARKRPLPPFPKAIGIVTSPTGAALHDLVWGFAKRFPPAQLYFIPVAVQGENAAGEVAAAVHEFNRFGRVDFIVVGRGGGSLEDLWAFNEEVLVRAVAESRIPVVSAVGHEVDVTLCDLAADVRAPTPTAAAAVSVPDAGELRQVLNKQAHRLIRSLTSALAERRTRLELMARSYGLRMMGARLGDTRLRTDEMARRLDGAVLRMLQSGRESLRRAGLHLQALSPQAVLSRGYAVAWGRTGAVVRDSRQVAVGEELTIQFARGRALSRIEEVHDYEQ